MSLQIQRCYKVSFVVCPLHAYLVVAGTGSDHSIRTPFVCVGQCWLGWRREWAQFDNGSQLLFLFLYAIFKIDPKLFFCLSVCILNFFSFSFEWILCLFMQISGYCTTVWSCPCETSLLCLFHGCWMSPPLLLIYISCLTERPFCHV